MAAAPQTGIKNADDLINLAHAFGLTITVETTNRETLTAYVVRISIPVPPAYAGTELGRTIAGDTLTLLWTKAHRSGARGRLEDATASTIDSHRKVRTQQHVTNHIHLMGRQSARYVRETAPQVEDVVDASHALFIDGARRSTKGVSADFVRNVVRNRRHHGRPTHQDADGTIVIENRRYVPQTAPVAEQPAEERSAAPTPRFHMRIVNGGTPERIDSRTAMCEIDNAMMEPGKRAVRTMSASGRHARIVYKDVRGEVVLRPATAEETAVDVKPESERYAPGNTVIVRPVSYDPETRTHRVFPEYTGTVVNWGSPHYYVRAVLTDAYGHGVRPCHVHELRPATEEECTAAQDRRERAAEARAEMGRLEAQSLATNQVIAERAATVLIAAGHTARTDGREGFRFDVDYLAARLRAEYANGDTWQDGMDAYAATLEAAGWVAEPRRSVRFGAHLDILPPYPLAADVVMEGKSRREAAERAQDRAPAVRH